MAEDTEPGAKEPKRPSKAEYTLSGLDQIKVLADPLRIRILEGFCQERTTKQVADLIGEKPTKLYHHVEALERVGLIELSRTKPNRGTLEKYYLAVARSFRADASAFAGPEETPGSEETETLKTMVSTVLDTTSAELKELISQGDALTDLEDKGVLTFVEIRATREEIDEIREKIHGLVQSLTDAAGGEEETEGLVRYRLTLAYYPLDT